MSLAALFGRKPIEETAELKRIRNLPRRNWTEEETAALARQLTILLRKTNSTAELRNVQALALHDAGTIGGLFAPIVVGGGKTLISLLLPYVLDSQRPILLTRAALIEKTKRERDRLREDWLIPTNINIIPYEKLSRASAEKLLDWLEPDLIILDEAHRVKRKKAGVTRRVTRYMKANPTTLVAAMSGTMMSQSVKDFAHILEWCLKGGAPVPRGGELEEWAEAIDEKVSPLARRDPGALLTLSPDDGVGDWISRGRKCFQNRLLSTPGVVASLGTDGFAGSLFITSLKYDVNPATEKNFYTLRGGPDFLENPGWMTPDGWALTVAAEIWAKARELALGFHYVWDPRPPDEWLMARKQWAAFVRETISDSRTLDTEQTVANAIEKGTIDSPEWWAWKGVRDTFKKNQKAIWHDDSALKVCEDWLKQGPGIVWCEHAFFARELSRRSGVPYYGSEGKTDKGEFVEDLKKGASGILSVAANQEGRNIQHIWNRCLVTAMPDAKTFEQMIGRIHRAGQEEDEVEVDILMGCREHYGSWLTAVAASQMNKDTMGQPQKVLIADIDMPTEEEVRTYQGYRWVK